MSVWSALGSIGGSLISGVLGLFGANQSSKQQQNYNITNMASQAKYNKDEMKYANELNKDLAKFNQNLTLENLAASPYALRQGMEYAGFNPVLAYSSGSFSNASAPGSAQALGSSLPSSQAPDYSGAVTNALQSGLAIQNQINQNKIANAQVANIRADSELKDMMASSESVKQMVGLTEQEMNWVKTEQYRLDNELKKKDISWYEYKQRREDLHLQVERIKARAAQVTSNAAIQNADTNAQQLGVNRYKAETERGMNNWDIDLFKVLKYGRRGYSKRHD